MERVVVYLRTSLFTTGGPNAHLPTGVMILHGAVAPESSGSLRITVDRMEDGRGKTLGDGPIVLQIPWGKVDHLEIVEA